MLVSAQLALHAVHAGPCAIAEHAGHAGPCAIAGQAPVCVHVCGWGGMWVWRGGKEERYGESIGRTLRMGVRPGLLMNTCIHAQTCTPTWVRTRWIFGPSSLMENF